MTRIVWLRNDLRLQDHPGFALACGSQEQVSAVHIATPTQWQLHNESPARQGLRAALLQNLEQQLAQSGIPLIHLQAETFADCPQLLADLCKELRCEDIYWLEESPLNERNRDAETEALLSQLKIRCHQLPVDQLVSAEVTNQQGQPYKVFTPFYRRWLQLLQASELTPFSVPDAQSDAFQTTPFTPEWAGDYRSDLWPADQQSIAQKLQRFCQAKLEHYGARRDIPSEPATSTLSPYLALGAIGPRQIISAMRNSAWGVDYWLESDWLRELAWRDFYRQLLIQFPQLNRHQPFKPETDKIQWRNDEHQWQAWCEGKTGFPIIDAAQRQLLQTGWMHNRLRMLTASFLTKLMFQDWRKGEAFFMQHLVDGDFAANNGGWQWSASVGCDAAPYFRVFNPIRQSEKFDPEGSFIRRFVPELASLDDKNIHFPSSEQRRSCGYPEAIVDYSAARTHAIETFKAL